ncbi:Pentatricopeptide repeat-containing protein [Rhynchospora pubera]|uniref:Pentatricopeptide repeat-containing protein n=2 Tax=Rhynchospora pubera TaxID=906938 RepID=A0AAV8HSQ9_9POAL|nr:Pentatricopeptide repeat-containing protein [Rhynchospora pubera]
MFSLSLSPMEKSLSTCKPKPKVYSKPRKQGAPFSLDARLLELSSHGKLNEAIFILQQSDSVKPKTYISLLQSCADLGSIEIGRKLHSCARLLPGTNCAVETKMVSMFAKCGSLEDARKVFDKMPKRTLITWSVMIGAYVREERWDEAVDLFYLMMREGVIPDSFLLPRIVQACASIGDCKTAQLLHSIAEKKGFLDPTVDTHVANSILAMYFKCGKVKDGRKFFEKMSYRNLVSWNSVISGLSQHGLREEAIRVFDLLISEGLKPDIFTWNIYLSNFSKFENVSLKFATDLIRKMENQGISPDVFSWTSLVSGFVQSGKCRDALQLFDEMLKSKVEPNSMTIACVLSACAKLKWLSTGKLLHSYSIRKGIDKSVLLANSLIGMYAKCMMLEEAQKVFDKMSDRDVVSWNSIIGGYAQARFYSKAFELFSLMDKFGFQRNAVTWNAIISGLFQNGEVDGALELLSKMEASGVTRNLASWNTIIAGMVQNGYFDEALNIFRRMQRVPVRPNSVTYLSIVPALENLVCSSKVREMHGFMIRTGLEYVCTPVTNALINAYSKSGNLNSALALFNLLSIRTQISWNCIIGSCVFHGDACTALKLFSEMRKHGVLPNHTTLSSVITAYGLEGLVREGEELFSSMSEQYGVNPNCRHYASMINLYCLADRLNDAQNLFHRMPIEPDKEVWDALLKAAGMNSDLEFTTHIAENLLKVEPWDLRTQKLLSNLYNLAGNLKNPLAPSKDGSSHGRCYTEVWNNVYGFPTGDLHLKTKLGELIEVAIDSGLELSQVSSLLDYEEVREENGRVHSEKEAIAFQILNSTRKVIRIIKNGRVCTHCHAFAKWVCKLHNREIFIKDSSRLHRFNDGECSCRDYW